MIAIKIKVNKLLIVVLNMIISLEQLFNQKINASKRTGETYTIFINNKYTQNCQ